MRTICAMFFAFGCGSKAAPPPAAPATSAEPVTATATETAPPSPTSDTAGLLAASALAEQYEIGKAVYVSEKCASCHEANGAGNPKNPALIGEAALPASAP